MQSKKSTLDLFNEIYVSYIEAHNAAQEAAAEALSDATEDVLSELARRPDEGDVVKIAARRVLRRRREDEALSDAGGIQLGDQGDSSLDVREAGTR